jgi:hypothetical protein
MAKGFIKPDDVRVPRQERIVNLIRTTDTLDVGPWRRGSPNGLAVDDVH